ncbi:phage tail protein [Aquabacterium sp.]|uniref:phage tail protein n=1 Tax=Aquabacterium sp. TaxID=1872578 RepID=UPI00378377C3
MKRSTSLLARATGVLAASLLASAAHATCSAEPYMASICITAATYCPRGYLETNGQVMSIAQNSALFSLVGTTYGGNGTTTFNLPNIQSRVPVHIGQGAGLAPVVLGEMAGVENVTITQQQMPPHTHPATLNGLAAAGNTDMPTGAVPAQLARSNVYSNQPANVAMGASAITVGQAGNGQPMPIRNPYIGLRYCIAVQGLYPPRD